MQYNIFKAVVEEVGPVESGYSEPVELEDLKGHLRLNSGTSEDTELARFVTAARQAFEFASDGRIVLPTVFRQWLTCWPVDRCGANDPIRLERGKVTEVTAVTYTDPDGNEQELEGWETDLSGIPAVVYLPEGNYPALSATKLRPVCVEFVAGWESVADVPQDVKLSILLLAGTFYEQREAFSEASFQELPMGFQRVANKYNTGLASVI